MTLYEFMEDFDNAELPEDEWQDQMEGAVSEWYERYDSPEHRLRVDAAIRNYKSWKREQQKQVQL
jgi:hypothetical protein